MPVAPPTTLIVPPVNVQPIRLVTSRYAPLIDMFVGGDGREIWLVREGTAELTTNGVARKIVAGDVGLCVAGDTHFIANTSKAPVTYFVVTVGPPE